MLILLLLLALILSASITYLTTPFVIRLARKLQLVDDPSLRPHPAHTHKGKLPRAGGLAIFSGIFISLFLVSAPHTIIFGIFISAAILVLVGIWDDRKDRSPYIRFATNSLATLLVIIAGISIPYITNPFGGIIQLDAFQVSFTLVGLPLTITAAHVVAFLWIVWMTNIIGWSGGVDGQLPGFVSISAFVIGLLSLRYATVDENQVHVTLLSFATAGAFLGFLPWNFYPQKIMPGYGGKTLAGFLLAVLSILSFSKLGTALLVLVIPFTDAIFILFQRLLSKRSPMHASSNHLHHHLLALGWGRRKIAVFYWIISALTGTASLILNSKQKVFVVLLVLVLTAGFILWINFLIKLPHKWREEEY
ncbi:undecaprenyl/decaprenyl-phosphate alpha-N-acetylglucosaminyl 1-phosphate transferase [Candidatus Gottesmanbacteria bacterium]|nr:undecaprenyl/decaprenyl-phosphate alpha-N-acetylglucosaminyl 1-phosphate transferase [Candidatus Gottesmanbacteria bacterium]